MKVAAISALALTSALASPIAAQAQTFDGPSIGVQSGWTEEKVRDPQTDLGVTTIDASKDSASFGGYVGYDKTIGNFVLGTEAGFGVKTSDNIMGGPANARARIDPKWSFDVTARAGYLITPKTLLYARGGYANSRIETSLATPAGTNVVSENRDGWLVGGGIEREIVPHVSARIEYRYSDLSQGDGKYDSHQTLLGLTYRF